MTATITRIAATVALTVSLGLVALGTPAPSVAADASGGSSWCTDAAHPWLCYSWLAGYRAFQYSSCSGAWKRCS